MESAKPGIGFSPPWRKRWSNMSPGFHKTMHDVHLLKSVFRGAVNSLFFALGLLIGFSVNIKALIIKARSYVTVSARGAQQFQFRSICMDGKGPHAHMR